MSSVSLAPLRQFSIALAATVVLLPSVPVSALAQQQVETAWSIGGTREGYSFDTTGVIGSAPGATALLRISGATAPTASLSKIFPADTLRMKRVRLSGSIRSTGVTNASLWMRVDAPAGMLVLDNGMDRALRGTQDWTEFSVVLPVPSSASRVVVGLLMGGSGEMEARNLRLEVLGAIDPKAKMHPDAKQLVDAAITVARDRSVWRDTLSWNKIEPEVRALAAGAASAAEAYPAVRFLAARLGDGHSSFMPPVVAQAFASGGMQNPEPVVKPISQNVGYINVPGFGGGDPAAIRRYASSMHSRLMASMPVAACGWVLDLRQNSGGNMYPMLAGLRPFLGDGTLGYFVSSGVKSPWSAGMRDAVLPPRDLDDLGKAYVAVLTGPRTASSGEIVAISFRERSRTRSFGLPTRGLSTANAMVPLPGGANFNITTAIDADRKGKLFGHAVDPDERVEAAQDATQDPTLERATAWLLKESGCGK
jgi:carboxyl-terminal processing protease